MSQKVIVSLIVLVLLVFLGLNSFFVVSAWQRGVLLRFGQVVENNMSPGLHWKIPFIDVPRLFDGRLKTLDLPSERFLTQEQKALIVDAYIKWKVANVNTFYKASSGDVYRTNALLAQRAESRMRNQFGNLTLTDVVSGQRDKMMRKITDDLNEIAQKELGVSVIDVRIKRIDLPAQVSDSVFQRMASDREKEAQEYRSEGKEQAEGIRANADREVKIILAKAYEKAESLKGEGDAKAANIYAQAYKKDPAFYSFYRSIEAYRKSFSSKQDMIVLSPDNAFFKYFNQLDPKQSLALDKK